MPVFFNLQSHLWIAYLFFLNGLLMSWLLARRSQQWAMLSAHLEAQIVLAFFLSISVNVVLLLAFQLLGLPYAELIWLLPMLTLLLAFLVVRVRAWQPMLDILQRSAPRAVLYLIIFIVLFYNGGLVEQISDAWWHMSLANKMAFHNTLHLPTGHLTGLPDRYYPPLWHGNLALLKVLSGESLVNLWNSFTAWGAVIKCMAFWLFAFALSHDRRVATLSVLLFVLLPGLGASYMRVSAWPSHIAYTAWFLLFYVAFMLFDATRIEHLKQLPGWLASKANLVLMGVAAWLAVLLWYLHQIELLYFGVGLSVYFVALLMAGKARDATLEPGMLFMQLGGILMLLLGITSSGYRLFELFSEQSPNADVLLAFGVCAGFLTLVLVMYFLVKNPGSASRWFWAVPLAVMVATVDLRHVASLFDPSIAYPLGARPERPLLALGWFGNELRLPGWHLQLRAGLLFSGLLALPISLWLAWQAPSRATLFVAANCVFAWLLICSPYLYEWLTSLLNYHSTWRFALLIFHPIVFALLALRGWEAWRAR